MLQAREPHSMVGIGKKIKGDMNVSKGNIATQKSHLCIVSGEERSQV